MFFILQYNYIFIAMPINMIHDPAMKFQTTKKKDENKIK